jgi:hypothetical protein
MGLFWDLVQSSAIEAGKQEQAAARKKARTIDTRVRTLEIELADVKATLAEMTRRLETQPGGTTDENHTNDDQT